MDPERRLRPTERRYAIALAVIGTAVALIAQLTRPATDDVDGLIGVLGLVFSIGYLALLGVSVLIARHRLSSTVARQATILAGPIVGLFALDGVIRALI